MITTRSARTTPQVADPVSSSIQIRLFLIRGLVAIIWAAAFAIVGASVTTALTVAAGVLLVVYPLIDELGSLIDARNQQGSARRLLLSDAAVSTIAAIALGVAATAGVTQVLVVFGLWGALAGAAQLVVALCRRALLGRQWPMLLAGGVSVLFGIAFVTAAVVGHAMLIMLALYAATGGVDFIIQAWLLVRRRRLATAASPLRRAS